MWPKITFRRLERLSLRPPTTPTTKPPPPRERRNIGRMGIIISLLKSLRKLVRPRSSILRVFSVIISHIQYSFISKRFSMTVLQR